MKAARTIRLAVITFFFLLCHSGSFAAQDVMVVKGHAIKPYDEAIKGFKNVCGCSVTELVSSEMEDVEVLREIRKARPRLVFAVGTEALSVVKEISAIPIVYAMVPNPSSELLKGKNVSGVSMDIGPEKYLGEVRRALPKVKRIGLVYDPAKTGHYVKRAMEAAGVMGITLTAKEVGSPREALSAMQEMEGKIELFWMLPDSTAVTPETVEFLFYSSFENRTPVLAFAQKYVDMGALLSVSIDAFDAGRQAGEMGRTVLSGGSMKDLPAAAVPERPVLSINLKTAKKIRTAFSDAIMNRLRTAQ